MDSIRKIRNKYLGTDSLQVVFDVEAARENVLSLLSRAQQNARDAKKEEHYLPQNWEKDILRSVSEEERKLKVVQGFIDELNGMLAKTRETVK